MHRLRRRDVCSSPIATMLYTHMNQPIWLAQNNTCGKESPCFVEVNDKIAFDLLYLDFCPRKQWGTERLVLRFCEVLVIPNISGFESWN